MVFFSPGQWLSHVKSLDVCLRKKHLGFLTQRGCLNQSCYLSKKEMMNIKMDSGAWQIYLLLYRNELTANDQPRGHMRVVLNSFIWKTPSSPKKNLLSPNFRELHVFLSRYMLAKIFKKNVDVWYPQIVPGVWSLVTLHSAAAVLKHLRSALRCWSLLTFIGQFWHNKSTV